MRIELLGTGGYYPNERRHTACVLVPELGIAFDAGTATFRLAERAITPEIHLFLTHAHLDHIAGLTYLLLPVLTGQFRRITVYGTSETLAAVQQHLFAKPIFPVDPPFECRELAKDSGTLNLSPEVMLSWQVLPSHPGGSMAYRLEQSNSTGQGWSMAYVTDTTVDGTYQDFIQGVDLLIHECYFKDEKANLAEKTGHSYSSAVAQLAQDAGVGELVLVHIDPTNISEDPVNLQAMQQQFSHIQLGQDGLVVTTSRRDNGFASC